MRAKSVKVAVSLPAEVWKRLEAVRRARKESRSSLFLEAILAWLEARERAERIRDYERGYRDAPETAEEVKASERAAVALLAAEEWE